MENEIVLETKLIGEIKGTFYVPSYQRGYRWGCDEVTRMLDDIYASGMKNKKGKYCLQPVVVRKIDDSYELVDGQQRLTTLYLIYRYIRNINPMFYDEPAFSLVYETREQSAEFLKNIDLDKRKDNIDFWFIANAYEVVKNWFEENLRIRVQKTYEFLTENVNIIWYEVGEEIDAISLFTRLNIGKIALTSAELVKAMFLNSSNYSNSQNSEIKKRQNEISLQWDNMEKELHDDSFWYFLTNNTSTRYQTRIDLVLDLISEKQNSREQYYTFFKFDEMLLKMKEAGESTEIAVQEIWREIQQTFLVLKDWHGDHEYYHKIGYLIASGYKSLHEIYELSRGKTKDEFKTELDELIKRSIAIKGNYADLSYEKQADYKRISRLLLLFNVESVRQNGEHSQWFPFDKYKVNKDNKVAWSLEHIHAQQSEGMRTQEMWKEWLKLHIPSVKNVAEDQDELIKSMELAITKEKLDRGEFDGLQQRVIELLSDGKAEYLHSVANLALLNSSDNAALNNSTFDAKRNVIIEMDKRGQFIPFCTKMVFLKYYTPSEKSQLHFWGEEDRDAYIASINTVLRNFLEEPISLGKEDLQ